MSATSKKLRLAAAPFLNTRPLISGLVAEPPADVELQMCSPSEGARRLAERECDMALLPVAALARQGDLVAVPGVCIGARHKVGSVLLVADVPLARADDGGARSVVAHVGDAGAPAPPRAPRHPRRAALRGAPAVRAGRLRRGYARRRHHRRPGAAGNCGTAIRATSTIWPSCGARSPASPSSSRCGPGAPTSSTAPSAACWRARSATGSSGSTRSPPTPAATASRPSARAATCATSSASASTTSWSPAPTSTWRAPPPPACCRAATVRRFGDAPPVVDRRARIERGANGVRLSAAEMTAMLERADLIELGAAADRRRRALNPDGVVSYIVERNINYTNVCVTACRFCAFFRNPGDTVEGYVLSREEMGQKIEETVAAGGVQNPAAGRAQPRAAAHLVRGAVPPPEGDLSDQAARALARGDLCTCAASSRCRSRRCCSACVAAGLDSLAGRRRRDPRRPRARAHRQAQVQLVGVAGGDARRPSARAALVVDDDVRLRRDRCPSAPSTC